jgi:5-formyltetrahydrofolate cyclo-ligase
MASYQTPASDIKTVIRERVSSLLLDPTATPEGPIAYPDAVFDLQLDHYITNFQGFETATQRLIELPEWKAAHRVFITPDNSTQLLREYAIRQEKEMIMTTFGIRRGSVLVTRRQVPQGQEEYASSLVGMEKYGRRLSTINDLEMTGPLDLMVTGALAVSRVHGGRAGKGAGWFDAEWGIWGSLHLVHPHTPVICIVHDCQVVPETFSLDSWDCKMNIIVTPGCVIRPEPSQQPLGILWDQINSPQQSKWVTAIPYMLELYQRQFGQAFPEPGSTK